MGRLSLEAHRSPRQDLLEKLTLSLFFIGIVLSITHSLWAYDIWWHLKTGEWIFHHRTVPRTDLYSYTAADHPWIDLSWGFQLLVYLFYTLWGIPGIILFKVAVVTLTFFLLFLFFYRRLPLWLILPALTATLLVTHYRLVERPEVLSFLFLVITLLLLEKDRDRPTKWLALLPLLQVVWVNSHSLFILGPLLVGTRCLGDLLKTRSSFPWKSCLVALSVCAASLINPYGLEGALFPRILFTRIGGSLKVFSLNITEFISPFLVPDPGVPGLLYKWLLLFVPFCFFLNRRRLSFFHLVTYLFFAFLSALAKRNIALFAFISCFLILKNLEEFLSEKPRLTQALRGLPVVLLAPALLLPILFLTPTLDPQRKGLDKRLGVGISPHHYCIQAARFIEKADLPGNFFNSGLEIGDYLVWHLSPGRKVFVDGRLEVYGGTFIEELLQLLENPSLWPERVQRYGINTCILDHTNPRNDGLLLWLFRSSDWIPIYLDGKVVLLMKKTAENRKVLNTYAMDLERDPLLPDSGDWVVEVGLAEFYTKLDLLGKAQSHYRRALPSLPRVAMVYHNFGNVLRSLGKTDEALSAYRQAIRLSPRDPLFHYGLGVLYAFLEEEEMAFKELKESVRLSPRFSEAHYQLGRLYEKKGRVTEAEKEYGLVERFHPIYPEARNALAVLYAQRGEFEKAEREFRDILKINPQAEGTLQNLRKLQRLKERESPQK